MRIGIDLGGSKIAGVLIDTAGSVVAQRRLVTPQGDYQRTVQAVCQLVKELEQNLLYSVPVGVGSPGTISPQTGKMRNCNSTCLNGQPLQQDLQQALGRAVQLANDANCFTRSEALQGAAAGFSWVFGVILGTGVGGGICHNGELLQGCNGIAGEWGHNPMPPLRTSDYACGAGSRLCYCGRVNCIETFLSGPGLEQSYRECGGGQCAAVDVVSAAERGEVLAQQVLDYYHECLASALATVINLLDPEVIVLGGGLSNCASLYREVPRRWQRYIFSDHYSTRLLAPKLGDASGVFGAAWLG